MKKLGQKLATSRPRPTRNLRERVKDAVTFYEALGGLAEIEEEGKNLVIRGYGCPLAEAVAAHGFQLHFKRNHGLHFIELNAAM